MTLLYVFFTAPPSDLANSVLEDTGCVTLLVTLLAMPQALFHGQNSPLARPSPVASSLLESLAAAPSGGGGPERAAR